MVVPHGTRSLALFAVTAAICSCWQARVQAIYWNNDPNFGFASSAGLSDRVIAGFAIGELNLLTPSPQRISE